MRRWISFLLPFVGLALFLFIVRGIGFDHIVAALSVIEPSHLLIFPVFVLFYHLIRGLRWQVLMKVVGIDYPLAQSMRLWSVGFFASSVTPGKVGDALRAYYLSKETGHNFGACLATVFADRMMDLVTILGGGLITTIVFSVTYIRVSSIWAIVLSVLGALVLMFLMLRREVVRWLVGPLVRAILPEAYVDELRRHFNSFYDALAQYNRRRGLTLLAYVFALVFWASVVTMATAVTRVMHIPVTAGYVLLIMPMLTLAEFLPISISGLGTRDAVAVWVFSVIGVSSAQAVGFSVMYLILGTYVTALFGFALWLVRPGSLRAGPPR